MITSNARAEGLLRLLETKNPVGVEVGVREAYYARNLLSCCNGLHLYCVDVWGDFTENQFSRYKASGDNIQNASPIKGMRQLSEAAARLENFAGRVNIIQLSSQRASKLFSEELDFVYLDADHTYEGVVEDIKHWWPCIKRGGLLSGHDYGYNRIDTDFGVKEAVDEFANNNKLKLNIWGGTNWGVVK